MDLRGDKVQSGRQAGQCGLHRPDVSFANAVPD